MSVEEDILNSHGVYVEDDQLKPPQGVGHWPELPEAALHGLAGDIVRTVLPHTEADPAALLLSVLAGTAAMVGDKPHIWVGGVKHGARVWPLVIGRTAGGMKGTSWAEIKHILRQVDPMFFHDHVKGGLSSAEGLLSAVRDESGDPEDEKHYDPGVTDKRLLIVETEFASVLAQGKRDGNTLLPTIRAAWDGGTLSNLTVNPRIATDPHIVIIGHITPTELRSKLADTERAGGTANRFLPVLSRRSKLLPSGGNLDHRDVERLAQRVAKAVAWGRDVGAMRRNAAAEEYWDALYRRLAAEEDGIGEHPVGEIIARGRPQLLRLSVMYALLDESAVIDVKHIRAAEAVWSYVVDSAWHVFAENPDLNRLKLFVMNAGPDGVSRSVISTKCFKGKRKADQLDELLDELVKSDAFEAVTRDTPGRKATVYRAKKAK
ncbi:hypothetical protein ACQPZP_14495 [Spirillospora sp. CA-142024]|uniref:hypothetical protein n=1 Tax=Spirillospora sp. CA-142024 TaxID=3240036 RepID=UPI003D9282D1